MQAWVEKLVELQDIDLKIAKLELQLGELPKRQAEAELQYKAEADALAAATNDLKQAEVAAKGIETQITTAREKKRDFQAKTITIKNTLKDVTPGTGDSRKTLLWAGLMLTSALGCAAALLAARRKQEA